MAEPDKVSRYGWVPPDKKGTFVEMPIGNLQIDHTYQRDKISTERVSAIAKDWSYAACVALGVVRRDGLYYVYDGQHRLAAAKQRGDISHLPCIVFEMNSTASEAKAFRQTNTVRGPVNSFYRFRASIIEQDPVAVEVQELVHSSGYEISNNSGGSHKVKAIGTLLAMYREDKSRAIKAWRVAVAVSDGQDVKEMFLAGLFFLELHLSKHTNQSIADKKNIDALIKFGLSEIFSSIAKAKAFYQTGGPRIYAQGLIQLMNRRRRTDLIPLLD